MKGSSFVKFRGEREGGSERGCEGVELGVTTVGVRVRVRGYAE